MAAEGTLNRVTEERCSRLSLSSTPANEESDSSLIQDKQHSTCATRKRKETDSSRKETVKQKRRKPAVKVMPKKKRQEMLKSVGSVQLNSFLVEVRTAVEEQFADSNFCEFISELFKEEEPIMQILRQHRDSFVLLYSECKQQKNSFMRFQLQWHYHCSAFLLEEKFTLASINLDESVHALLVAARNVWLEFCKKHNSPVPETNPVMMAISSRAYSYLLNQVSIYQANLAEQTSLVAAEVTSVGDGDDIYYRFGGAAICAMLKHRYKELKSCLRTDRNALSIQICMLQAMNLKDKSCIPDYLKHRDQGYMYFPHHSLIPFLRNLDTVVKETVNEDGFCKHGDDLIKVAHNEVKAATSLKEQYIEIVKLLFPIVIPDADSEDAMNTVYDELIRKLCNTRIQEFLSATKQDLAAKKGLASTVDVNLRTTLLTNHTKLSTIREM